MIPESFHFLRPAWLLAIAALPPIAWGLWRRARSAGAWERVCDAHLLRHLVAEGGGRAARWPVALLALGWIAACVALAGPTVERLPQVAYREPGRTVFVLGLADSMNQKDVKPSRLARARHKLADALDLVAKSGGSVGLVAYKEEGFAVTPLTDDAAVLREAIPLLETRLMPGRRVLPARGLEEAKRLLEPQRPNGARVVLVTDGNDADPKATRAAAAALADAGVRLSVLSLLPDVPGLEALAQGGGAYATLTVDDADLARVLVPGGEADPAHGGALAKSEATTDEWNDLGAWLVFVPLALAPLAFRRGWAAAAMALLFLQLAPAPAQAGALDAFQRPDQRGADAFEAGRFAESAQQFEDPAWQAAARYRAGDYAGAAQALTASADPSAPYNLGNALAKSGKLEEAVAAYDRALAATPDDEDARFNRELVKKLLEQQKQQQQSQQQQPNGGQGEGQGEKDAAAQSQGGQGESADAKGSSARAEKEGEAQGPSAQQGRQDAGADAQDQAKAGDEAKTAGDAKAKDEAKAGDEGRSGAQTGEEAKPGDAPSATGAQAASTPENDGRSAASQPPATAGDAEPATPPPPQTASAPGAPHEQAATGDPRGAAQAGDGTPLEAGDTPATPGSAPGAISRDEQERAQWMARLPDDPGGLLREKIRRDYLRKQAERQGEDRS